MKPLRAGDVLDAEQERDVGVSNREAFEVVVVRGHQVEEVLRAVAVEDHFAVARAFDHDRPVGRSARRQVVRAVEHGAEREIAGPRGAVHVVEAIADVECRRGRG